MAAKSEFLWHELKEGRPLVEVWVFQIEGDKNTIAGRDRRAGNDGDQLCGKLSMAFLGRHRGEEENQSAIDQEGQTDRAMRSHNWETRERAY